MIDHKCGLESCPAQAPLLELLRLVRHQSDLPEQSGQNGQNGQRRQRLRCESSDLRDLADGPQAREVLKAIGECPALLALACSDLAVEAEREAHEEKIKNYL